MTRRFWTTALTAGLLVGAAACSSDRLIVPNYNTPTTDGVVKDPAGLQLLVTGLLAGERGSNPILTFGIFGREAYNYFSTDGRFITHALVGIPGPQRLDPGGFYAGNWGNHYTNMRNAINIIDISSQSQLTAAQKAATAGLAKTFRALSMLYTIESRDTLGAPVEVPEDPNSPAPFVTRDSVYKFISALLDDAATNLQAGGTAFPFHLHPGYAGFDTPPTFLKFNRGLAARVLAYRGSMGCGAPCYQQALTALGGSFVTASGAATTQAQLDAGPFDPFSTATGDAQNGLSFSVNNALFAHASAFTDAQARTGGGKDLRMERKIVALATPVSPPQNLNIPATYRFTMYPTPSSPQYVMRNEELLLLRAEANIQTGNASAALPDINTVRTVSGGLAPLTALPAGAAAIDALLYERRFSLLYEGFRWVDMRRFGRLSQLPLDKPDQFVAKVMPIPLAECDARVVKPVGCEGLQ